MADKAISELTAATRITPTDLLVMEQDGSAKSVSGQILINFLTAIAGGHGGIQSIDLEKSEALKDTYRITLADQTIFYFTVTNGRGISGVVKTGTSGLVDTYTITYNDTTTGTFTVTNGEKGDKGDKGDPPTLVNSSITYQVGDSGTIIPSGSWVTTIPVVAQGRYLWTRTTQIFNTGDPVISYSVSRMGIDGAGSVSSVAGISPDAEGNVPLTAENVGALPSTGGDMEGPINMNGQNLSGLNVPTETDEAANKGYVDGKKVKRSITLSVSGWSGLTQTVSVSGVSADSDIILSPDRESCEAYMDSSVYCSSQGIGTLTFTCTETPEDDLMVNVLILN